MPRLMSFSLTTEQVRDGTKDVTRRMGWSDLEPGEVLVAVEKAMGLKRGEKVVRIRTIRVKSTRWEPVNAITPEDVVREGFPDWTPAEFVDFYCKPHKCRPEDLCNRIEFEYLDEGKA